MIKSKFKWDGTKNFVLTVEHQLIKVLISSYITRIKLWFFLHNLFSTKLIHRKLNNLHHLLLKNRDKKRTQTYLFNFSPSE